MNDLLAELGVELPVLQAGMGGGIAGPELAVAVTQAGGLGTLGFASPPRMSAHLAAARARTEGAVAVNILLPFVRSGHARIAGEADLVVTFWGTPERLSGKPWAHQVGSVDEARQAHAAGADAVIVQGVEAGGHVRGTTPGTRLLEQTLAALPRGYPVLLAGGIADAADVATALGSGAAAVVCGTRFLMSEESGASPGYKRRLVEGTETVLTELFGVGWPGAHRVLPNRATERWLSEDSRGPRAVRMFNRASRPVLSRSPESLQSWMLRRQRVGLPLFSPVPPARGTSDRVLETSPLYAGETVARIREIGSAASIVRDLVAGLPGR